jgi:hypothetical protein
VNIFLYRVALSTLIMQLVLDQNEYEREVNVHPKRELEGISATRTVSTLLLLRIGHYTYKKK